MVEPGLPALAPLRECAQETTVWKTSKFRCKSGVRAAEARFRRSEEDIMSLGKVASFTVGAVVGGVIGYAAVRSETVKKATKSTIKAGIKAKDWTAETFRKATGEVKEMVKDAKAEKKTAVKA
jgi:hypothetical protein